MKHRRISYLAAMLLGCFVVNAPGQEADTSSAAIAKKLQAAESIFRSVPYRTYATIESLNETDPYAVTRITTEIIPPNRRRLLQENGSEGVSKTRERINFDGRNYVRNDYQAWQTFADPALSGAVRPAQESNQTQAKWKITETGKYIERQVINGRDVDVFELRRESVNIDNGTTNIATSRFWLRADGRLIKKVNEIKRSADTGTNRTTVHYEYDNIFIEEPNVSPGN